MDDLRETLARALCNALVWNGICPCLQDECEPSTDDYQNADAALAAIESAGFKIVPVEPTEEMVMAAVDALYCTSILNSEEIGRQVVTLHRAMLSASPTTPTGESDAG